MKSKPDYEENMLGSILPKQTEIRHIVDLFHRYWKNMKRQEQKQLSFLLGFLWTDLRFKLYFCILSDTCIVHLRACIYKIITHSLIHKENCWRGLKHVLCLCLCYYIMSVWLWWFNIDWMANMEQYTPNVKCIKDKHLYGLCILQWRSDVCGEFPNHLAKF